MIWADRLAIAAYALWMMLWGWACATGDGPGANLSNFTAGAWRFGLVALGFWALLRLLDFAVGLPGWRARRRHG